MRVIVAGSRAATQKDVEHALRECPWIGFASKVVSGTAKGADQFGEAWAASEGLEVDRWPADWSKHGRAAGPVRNRLMSENAEALVAVWDGSSRGTLSMISQAKKRGLRVSVLRTDTREVEETPPAGELARVWEDADERAAIMQFDAGMSRRQAERAAGSEALTRAR